MRYLIAAAIWIVFASPGQAQTPTPECRTIKLPSERLACYDKINPPIVAPVQHGATKERADPVMNEDVVLKARLHDICQHC